MKNFIYKRDFLLLLFFIAWWKLRQSDDPRKYHIILRAWTGTVNLTRAGGFPIIPTPAI